MRELGELAYPPLRARLVALADAEAPETATLLGRLRELTSQDMGYEDAETPEARAAAREKWLTFLAR